MNNNTTKVVTRFAPSPTGKFHVGGIRSALYNYLYAKKHGGKFILRCEDTDPVRSKKEYEDYFLQLFEWLGLTYDEYYRQSERTNIYKKYLKQLIKEDKAYISKEEPRNESSLSNSDQFRNPKKNTEQRNEVIRFRNPNKIVTFHDEVLGDISFNTTELGDFVIARELHSPLYHFTVAVDDFEMGVTHIIRGQEHVSNTPRQILIQEAIGAPRPIYAHGSIILNEERAKLSKRDPLVRPALEYRDEGYLPDALLNFVALLGWNPGTEQEIFSREELITAFSFERMQKQGAVFNPEKLEWVNKEHMKRLSVKEKCSYLEGLMPASVMDIPGYSHEILLRATPTLVDHLSNFGEIKEQAERGDVGYFFKDPTYAPESLFWKGDPDKDHTRTQLEKVLEMLQKLSAGDFSAETTKAALWDYATEVGRGRVLWPMRYALSGRDKSADPFTLAGILGKETTIRRIKHAIHKLKM